MSDNFYGKKKFSNQLILNCNVFHLLKYFFFFVCCLLAYLVLLLAVIFLHTSLEQNSFLKVRKVPESRPRSSVHFPENWIRANIFSISKQTFWICTILMTCEQTWTFSGGSFSWLLSKCTQLLFSIVWCDEVTSLPSDWWLWLNGLWIVGHWCVSLESTCPNLLHTSSSPRLLHGWCVLTKPTRKHTNGANPEYQHRPSRLPHTSTRVLEGPTVNHHLQKILRVDVVFWFSVPQTLRSRVRLQRRHLPERVLQATGILQTAEAHLEGVRGALRHGWVWRSTMLAT